MREKKKQKNYKKKTKFLNKNYLAMKINHNSYV